MPGLSRRDAALAVVGVFGGSFTMGLFIAFALHLSCHGGQFAGIAAVCP
jgi:hypothetical protein